MHFLNCELNGGGVGKGGKKEVKLKKSMERIILF